jgi:hypothetical protein
VAISVITTIRNKDTTNENPRDLHGKNLLERDLCGFAKVLKVCAECMPWSYKCNMRKAGRSGGVWDRASIFQTAAAASSQKPGALTLRTPSEIRDAREAGPVAGIEEASVEPGKGGSG